MVINQRGQVAILTTLMFSILAVIVTIGTIIVQTRQLRQSSDTDQSVRALFAAESGLEQGMLDYKTSGGSYRQKTCKQINLPNNLEVTCLRVYLDSAELRGSLAQEESAHFDLGRSIRSMTISWNLGTFSANDRDYQNSGLPNKGRWNIPPVIEVSAYSYPMGSFGPNDIQVQHAIFRPSAQASSNPTFTLGPPNPAGDVPQLVRCNPNPSSFNCKLTITSGFDATRLYVVRIRPRYNGPTDYDVLFRGLNGAPITPKIGQITIDSTARAGSIYRRVVAFAQTPGTPLANGLDYVIFSQADICKDFTIVNGKFQGLLGISNNCRNQSTIEDNTP